MASTSNQINSSYYIPRSSSFTPRWKVFLSFRGEDTRKNFTGHLYKALDGAGIQTFMDDPKLERGEEISPALLKAIEESKISIVLISKNYASSTWCLEELVKILECRETKGQLVLPVFYKVNPSDVRYQCRSFEEAFEKHKIRFVADMDKVKKWRARLTEAAQLSGYHLDANGDESDLVDKIVERVYKEVKPGYLNVPKKLIGIASHVKNMTSLLSIGTNDVRKIGICGMGGVGKTTVAKVLYNENFHRFQGSCFLANVREISGQQNGIIRLQEQLVSDVRKSKKFTISSVDNGISIIQENICFKKVLIVLDDLDHLSQFKSLAGQWNQFASGSIIMITTRNARLLDQIQVDRRYMVEELNNNDSLELFRELAFGKTIPSDDFMKLSRKIIGYAGGLPLALEVFGAYLLNQDELEWTSFIKKLQENPNSEIEGKLEISFDTLENSDLKDIFLDIACFFIGKKKVEATAILKACYSCAENDIRILEKRCLLKFNDDELRMHDLLRDMGREIARNKFSREPQKHSRLWRCADICNVLKRDKGTESIEGIVPYGGKLDQVTLNTKTFERMHRLRLLDISGVDLTGSFAHIFEELRWLRWSHCSLECLPSDFHPEKLVILELQYSSNINTLWNGIKVLKHLTTLNLSSCNFLKTTIDFTGLSSLEELLLGGCTSLEGIHSSIGHLCRLVSLDLSYCTNLTCLPSEICNLTALESLNIEHCEKMRRLPEKFGNIQSLRKLSASYTEIRFLPDNICNLRALKCLKLNGCSNLERLPQELGRIESLESLSANQTLIIELPDSIGQLTKLLELNLYHCKKLRNLPSSICNLRALGSLNINGCSNLEGLPEDLGKMEGLRDLFGEGINLKRIPDSIGDMKNLRLLHLPSRGRLDSVVTQQFVPPSIAGLCSLTWLDLSNCYLLDEDIPDNIGSLSSLKELNLSGNRFSSLPSSLVQLSNLRRFFLKNCRRLRSLPGIPPNLYILRAQECTSLERLPNLSNLEELTDLDLTNCLRLQSLPGIPPNIRKLHARYCSLLERLPNLSNLEKLESLSLHHCSRLVEIQGLENLKSLTEVGIEGCNNLESTFRQRYRKV